MCPMNTNVKPFPNVYINRSGQLPLTAIRDLENSLKVEVMNISGIDSSLLEFTHCAHFNKAPDFSQDLSKTPNYKSGDTKEQTILRGLMEGTALWQGLETIHFKIKVTGCTRTFTHQLVRQRIGITFSQQCSGDMDWRHHDVILPRPLDCAKVVQGILNQKNLYCYLLDSGRSLQEARYVLPQCLETFIYFDASLATIKALYSKRICTMTQTWEMILFAFRLKCAILKKVPEIERAFFNPCETGKCWYQGAKKGNEETFLYQPDNAHDLFPWHPDSYIYLGTVEQISSRPEPVEEHYWQGTTLINKDLYETLSRTFKIWL